MLTVLWKIISWSIYTGVLVLEVTAGSVTSRFLQRNNVILSFDNKPVNNLHDLQMVSMSVIGSGIEIIIFLNLHKIKHQVKLK